MNRLVLTAQLVERGAMRYTPAGLPALDLSLKHESEVTQDGQPRKVSMEIKARAIGAIERADRRGGEACSWGSPHATCINCDGKGAASEQTSSVAPSSHLS